VVVVTGSDDGRDLIRAIDGGAMAYVHKRSPEQEIVRALNAALGGGIYLPEDMMALLDAARAAVSNGHTAPAEPIMAGVPMMGGGYALPQASAQTIARLGLTPRQTDVLMLLLHGKPNKLIARELNLSVETIKDHVAAVLRSLNVTSRTQAVLAVTQLSHGASAGGMPRRGLQ
jgi:DNA-binding NarL/FixJ family response regulator